MNLPELKARAVNWITYNCAPYVTEYLKQPSTLSLDHLIHLSPLHHIDCIIPISKYLSIPSYSHGHSNLQVLIKSTKVLQLKTVLTEC